jgi:hypothetical protein
MGKMMMMNHLMLIFPKKKKLQIKPSTSHPMTTESIGFTTWNDDFE